MTDFQKVRRGIEILSHYPSPGVAAVTGEVLISVAITDLLPDDTQTLESLGWVKSIHSGPGDSVWVWGG